MTKAGILAFSLAFFLPGACFGAVELVRDGRPVAEIVVAPDALQVIRVAAEDLQKHLELMSGAQLPIVQDPSPGSAARVYIGASALTEQLGFRPAAFKTSGLEVFARDNYVVLAGTDVQRERTPYEMTVQDSQYLSGAIPRPDNYPSPGLKAWQEFTGHKFTTQHLSDHLGSFNRPLGIHSNDDTGTWYAVAELLEQLGVRWYMPYEDGTVIPEKKTVAVAEQHTKKEAAFDRREWCFYGTMREDGEGIAWLKRLKAGNFNSILYNHTTYAIYSSKEQQELHPEYLARDASGKPYTGYPAGRSMPRYTDPGFRAAAATWMNKVFDTFPDLAALAVGPPDGGITMDARDVQIYGRDGDSLEQRTSNYAWDFHVFLARELAKSHPDKRLLYMTGAGGQLAPTNIDGFPGNLIVPLRGYSPAQRVLETTRRELFLAWDAWHSRMPAIQRAPVWNYFLWYRTADNPRYPVVFTRALQLETTEIQPLCDGKFIEIQPAQVKLPDGRTVSRLNTPGLIHLMVYLQNKFFWDPDLDLAALLNEYYTLFFGPAAAEMKEFYEYAETIWTRQESRSVTPTTGFLKAADVNRYFEILARARAKAGEDTVYERRIARMESEMQTLKTFFPNLSRTGPTIRAYNAPVPVTLDGDPAKYKYSWLTLADALTGETPAKNRTSAVVTLTPDRSAVYLLSVCYENRMEELKAGCDRNDDAAIFDDDTIEIYISTPQRSYFRIAVNPNGAVWDESTDVSIVERDTLPVLWNPGVQAKVVRHGDRWTVEIMIPAKDFGEMGPTQAFPWGVQIARTRFTGGHPESWALAPTGGDPANTTGKWASIWVR